VREKSWSIYIEGKVGKKIKVVLEM